MQQFKLTNDCVFKDNLPFRRRSEDQSLRAFFMDLIDEFYDGEEYRFNAVDDLGLACLVATAICVHHQPNWFATSLEKRALIFATRSGSIHTDHEYQNSISRGGRTSARVFVQTLPNMAAGQVAACFECKGEYFVLVQSERNMEALETATQLTLKYGDAHCCLMGWVEHDISGELTVELSIVYASEKDQLSATSELALIGRS